MKDGLTLKLSCSHGVKAELVGVERLCHGQAYVIVCIKFLRNMVA
jgi:hypothetical protein